MRAIFLATAALSGIVLAESAIPTAFTRERYHNSFSDSPFAVATPEEKKVEEKPDSPLNNLVVTGMGKLDDGRNFVIVKRVGDEASMRFEGNTKNREGLAVKQVKWGTKWGESRVVMTHESEEKEIEFNQNAVASTPGPTPPQGGMTRGPRGAVNAPQPPPIVQGAATPATVQRPPSITPTIPRPTTGGIQVPRPGGGAQLQPGSTFRGTPQTGTNVPVPTNSGAPRSRVRSINNR